MTPGAVYTPSRHASEFYKRVLQVFADTGLDFLVGGAFAFARYAGVDRNTKDIDIFIRRRDWPKASEVLARRGIDTELTYPHWLGKAFGGRSREFFVDIIFSSGNGVAEVDEEWFAHAPPGEAVGLPVKLMPVEEMIWSKAFLMERERYDGADVAHLIRACHHQIDWHRLLARFGGHWPVLLAHLVMYAYIYPGEPRPQGVMDELLRRAAAGRERLDPDLRICRGTLLSREQYLIDVEGWNYLDARLAPLGTMTPEEAATWTEAIRDHA